MRKSAIALALLSATLLLPAQSRAETLTPVTPNVEYFRDYELTYLAKCGEREAAADCQWSMEQLQTRMGFFEFARLVGTEWIQTASIAK